MKFEEVNAVGHLVTMGPQQLDELSFGVVAMNLEGEVTHYNTSESDAAGLSPERVVGKHFFSEVAPCTNNFMVAQRFEDEDDLNEALDYVFTLKMKPTPVELRLLKSTEHRKQFLLVRWQSG